MSARQVALPVAAITFLSGAFSILQTYYPAIAGPSFRLGVSAVVLVGTLFVFALNPGVVFGIGYWASGGADVPTNWSAFASWAFVAAVAGYLAGGLLGVGFVALVSEYPRLGSFNIYYNVAFTAVFGGVRAGLAGLAGASVGHFRLNG